MVAASYLGGDPCVTLSIGCFGHSGLLDLRIGTRHFGQCQMVSFLPKPGTRRSTIQLACSLISQVSSAIEISAQQDRGRGSDHAVTSANVFGCELGRN